MQRTLTVALFALALLPASAAADEKLTLRTPPHQPFRTGDPVDARLDVSVDHLFGGGRIEALWQPAGQACAADPSSDGGTAVDAGDLPVHKGPDTIRETVALETSQPGDYVLCVWLLGRRGATIAQVSNPFTTTDRPPRKSLVIPGWNPHTAARDTLAPSEVAHAMGAPVRYTNCSGVSELTSSPIAGSAFERANGSICSWEAAELPILRIVLVPEPRRATLRHLRSISRHRPRGGPVLLAVKGRLGMEVFITEHARNLSHRAELRRIAVLHRRERALVRKIFARVHVPQ